MSASSPAASSAVPDKPGRPWLCHPGNAMLQCWVGRNAASGDLVYGWHASLNINVAWQEVCMPRCLLLQSALVQAGLLLHCAAPQMAWPARGNRRALIQAVSVCSLVVLVHDCVGRVPTGLVTGEALAEFTHLRVCTLAATHHQQDSLSAAAVPLSSRHGGFAASVACSSSAACLHFLPAAAFAGELGNVADSDTWTSPFCRTCMSSSSRCWPPLPNSGCSFW